MLKAKGGSDDLSVFVEETDAGGWTDGTRVKMVVEAVKRTVDGETGDGWLEAKSVETLAPTTTGGGDGSRDGQQIITRASTYALTLNKSLDATIIDGVTPGPGGASVVVTLNPGVASLSVLELATAIRQMNQTIVGLTGDSDSALIVKFELAGELVAENRYVLDPENVTFKGSLDD